MSDLATNVERWLEAGILTVDTQIYDMTAVVPFVDEMVEAAMEADAPMLQGGRLPARHTLFYVSGGEDRESSFGIYAEDRGDGSLRCTFAGHLLHNKIVSIMRETAAKLQVRMVEGNLSAAELRAISILEKDEWMDERLPQNRVRPLHEFRVGAVIDPAAPTEAVAIGRYVSAACEFLAMPIAARTQGALPRAARRRLERSGKTVKLTNVTVTRSVTAGMNRPHQPGEHGKALHFVSGHWRVSPTSLHGQMMHGQWKIWIEGHWRGDPEFGVVLHRYLARKRNNRNEGIAA
jgi:hypothetical protein